MTTEKHTPEQNMPPQGSPAEQVSNMFTLSEDPHQAIHDMMRTIDDLREIYAEENEALKSSDTKRFVSLQKRKIEAAYQYRAGSQQIISRREEFKKLDPALRQQLVEKQEEFSKLANANLEALGRMKGTLDQLNERILRAARKAVVKKNINYGRQGKIDGQEECLSLGLNESA